MKSGASVIQIEDVVRAARDRGFIPDIPDDLELPLPAVNKVEFYLSFHGNDRCAHCISCSGPHKQETISPADAMEIVKNVESFSILNRLKTVLGEGSFKFDRPEKCKKLDAMKKPPRVLTGEFKQDYADCLMGKGFTSQWIGSDEITHLNFGRPSIRLSGGEFSTWPHQIDGRRVPEKERFRYQRELLEHIRKLLPEYDIFILTNGRFAEKAEMTDRVIRQWLDTGQRGGGRTRICISVDVFHSPPPGNTVQGMLRQIWSACRHYGISAPYLYGITNNRVMLLGRALETFGCCKMNIVKPENISRSSINPVEEIHLDPVDLISTGGCNELKGFFCATKRGTILVNNIVILPTGNLAYCCACVGDFGNFKDDPERSLENIVRDPVALMLRREQTAVNLLNIAVEMDPSIKLFGSEKNAAVTGSTCYQLLSGKRLAGGREPSSSSSP